MTPNQTIPTTKSIMVQFCSGNSRIPNWENRDSDCDITKPLPYKDASVTKVRIEHGAEHITTHQCLGFFKEVHRILQSGGTFRVSVPVLDRLPPEQARDIILGHGHQCAFSSQLLVDFLRAAGFDRVKFVPRDEFDFHWKVIGKDKDDLETCRVEATK
jgi:predicted SAM-dependent methyltransferase